MSSNHDGGSLLEDIKALVGVALHLIRYRATHSMQSEQRIINARIKLKEALNELEQVDEPPMH